MALHAWDLHLAERRAGPTFVRATGAREASIMTPLEWFGFVVSPLLLFAIGAGVVYFTGRRP
jgi:hypothetical protein